MGRNVDPEEHREQIDGDQEQGGMYWLSGQWEQNCWRGSLWPVLTPLSSHVLCLRPGKRGGNGEKEGLEGEKDEGVEVKGGGCPQCDSRRQNVSRSQRKSMLCMHSTLNLYQLMIEKGAYAATKHTHTSIHTHKHLASKGKIRNLISIKLKQDQAC